MKLDIACFFSLNNQSKLKCCKIFSHSSDIINSFPLNSIVLIRNLSSFLMYVINWSSSIFLEPNFCLHKNCFANRITVLITPLDLISPNIASFLSNLKLGKYEVKIFPTIFQKSLTTKQPQIRSGSRSEWAVQKEHLGSWKGLYLLTE